MPAAGFALMTAGFVLVAAVLALSGDDGPSGRAGLLSLTAFIVLLTVGRWSCCR